MCKLCVLCTCESVTDSECVNCLLGCNVLRTRESVTDSACVQNSLGSIYNVLRTCGTRLTANGVCRCERLALYFTAVFDGKS